MTAESIISTLQMEMATVGLTAAAISAATRHLEPEQPASPPTSHTIAPRPSLARLDMAETISSLPDNLASLLVSDQTPTSSFSSLLSTSPNTSRQSRLATMFSSEPSQIQLNNISGLPDSTATGLAPGNVSISETDIAERDLNNDLNNAINQGK